MDARDFDSTQSQSIVPAIMILLGERTAFKADIIQELTGSNIEGEQDEATPETVPILYARRFLSSVGPPVFGKHPRIVQRVAPLDRIPRFSAVIETPLVIDRENHSIHAWRLIASTVVITLDGARPLSVDELRMIAALAHTASAEQVVFVVDASSWVRSSGTNDRRVTLRNYLCWAMGKEGESRDEEWASERIIEIVPSDGAFPVDPLRIQIERVCRNDMPAEATFGLRERFGNLSADLSDALRAIEVATVGLARERARVSFVGLFNAGKTTTINAMLDSDLPVGILPTTAAITRILPGVSNKARVLRSGSHDEWETVSIEVGQLLSQSSDVHIVELQEPMPWGPQVSISDTPGLSDDEALTNRTFAEIEASDLVVVLISADQALSAEEVRLIERADHLLGGNVLLVISRMSQVREADRLRVQAYVEARTRAIGNAYTGGDLMVLVHDPQEDGYRLEIDALRDRIGDLLLRQDRSGVLATSRLGVLEDCHHRVDQVIADLAAEFDRDAAAAIAAQHAHRVSAFRERAHEAREQIDALHELCDTIRRAIPTSYADETKEYGGALVALAAKLHRDVLDVAKSVQKEVDKTRASLSEVLGYQAPRLEWESGVLDDPYEISQLISLDVPYKEVATIIRRTIFKSTIFGSTDDMYDQQRAQRRADRYRQWVDMHQVAASRCERLILDLVAYIARLQADLTIFANEYLPVPPTLAEADSELAQKQEMVTHLRDELAFERDRVNLMKGLMA